MTIEEAIKHAEEMEIEQIRLMFLVIYCYYLVDFKILSSHIGFLLKIVFVTEQIGYCSVFLIHCICCINFYICIYRG
jgi:hypothetical protein